MSVTARLYGTAAKHTSGDSFLANDIRVALLADTYTPSQDNHEFWADVKAYEASGTNYAPGGLSLGGKTVSYDGTTKKLKFTSVNPQFLNVTVTARHAVFYDRTPGSDATRPVISYVDFGENKSASSGPFTLTLDANGIFSITVA